MKTILKYFWILLTLFALFTPRLVSETGDSPEAEKVAEKGLSGNPEEPLADAVPEQDGVGRPLVEEEKKSDPPSSKINKITQIDFKVEDGPSRILLRADRALKFKQAKNSTVKQVVFMFENTSALQSIQRAYDTSDFKTPVALFTLLETGKGPAPATRLVVQLRDNIFPKVMSVDNQLIIEFPPMGKDVPRFTDADDALEIEENTFVGAQSFTGKPLERLEIKNSNVQDVIRLIAGSSGYNVVIGDDVTGKIGSLSLTNVPWDQAFALVLQSKGLGYVRQGKIIRVAKLETLRREKTEAVASENARVSAEPLRTILIPINYAKAQELVERARPFLTERGKADVDSRTNTIILRDTDQSVTRVQKLFTVLDNPPSQVTISARIVEMSSTFSRAVGVRTFNFDVSGGGGLNLESRTTLDAKASTTATIRAPSFANLMTEFRVGELESKVRTLATPSATVVANQSGMINQAISYFVINGDAVAGGAVIPGVRQITANLNMDVLPIVSGEGSIFLTANIRNEIPVGSPPDLKIDSRNVKTQILIDNGDTAVVGGVFQDTVNQSKEGVPLLMDIPILGIFFSRHAVSDAKNEIFIFLTAKITNADELANSTL